MSFQNFKLETERLLLKVLDDSYANSVLEYQNGNKHFLEKWEAIKDEIFFTLGFQKQLLLDESKKMNYGYMFKVWIFEKGNDKIIGSISLNNIVRGCFHSCFLGYKLDKDHVNKRYMTEGVEAVIKYAFEQLHLHRIEANIMPKNAASLKVVTKLGFINEGISKKYLKINGIWEDHIHMVILNDNLD